MRDELPKKPPKRSEPKEAADRLRNLYRSGDETGRTKPDRNGETFQGLERKKRRSDER